ncbi:MAG: efflux RND transporter permease subunit, partial [Candidatus Hydrogenedentes bacterium]|nr:efflux RND transporter permease subunit [Candidatus Hydrogenedentota bacterium]
MKRSLPTYALKHPVTVCTVIVALAVVAVIAWHLIQVELMISIDFMIVRCFIPYYGATPEQVESEVTIPAEGKFRTVPDLKRIASYSSGGGCSIEMIFDWDAEMSEILAEVRDRIERIKLVLPAEIDRLFLSRSNSLTQAMMSFTVFSEGDQNELAQWARTRLHPRLMRLDGVADVQISGPSAGTVYVEFDQGALHSANLSLSRV